MVHGTKKQNIWAVVVAQLVERSLPTPEVRGLNPVIGKLLYGTFVYWQLYWKDENKQKKRPGMAHFFFKKKKQNTLNLKQPFKTEIDYSPLMPIFPNSCLSPITPLPIVIYLSYPFLHMSQFWLSCICPVSRLYSKIHPCPPILPYLLLPTYPTLSCLCPYS